MRNDEEVFKQIIDFAQKEDNIRIVSLEGSRANTNIPADAFRDYDITFIVQDERQYLASDDWLGVFGEIVMMQKPTELSFITAKCNWYTYLMLFSDKVRIDLKLVPLSDLTKYLSSSKLIEILLDKDNAIAKPPLPSDEDYWLKKPKAQEFDDCCNEFWWVSSYIAKGLCREELIYSARHMETFVRPRLLQMLSWLIGLQHGFVFSLGKDHKFLRNYLQQRQWDYLLKTYRLDSIDACWQALAFSHALFRDASRLVAKELAFKYPSYDKVITNHIKNLGLEETV